MSKAMAVLTVLTACCSCGVDHPEGRYSCVPGMTGQCPPGMQCHSDGRCRSGVEDVPDVEDVADDDDDGDGDESEGRLDEVMDEGPEACDPAACDDGDPCNGVERCADGPLCEPGEPMPDFADCRTEDGVHGACVGGQCRWEFEQVEIPAGSFVRGSDAGEGDTNEMPEHVVTLTRRFRIDRFEVTNSRYAACVSARACRAPSSLNSHTRNGYFGDPSYGAYPVLRVSWDDAAAYCAWIGRRLPTEAEWEMAARGGCDVVVPAACGAEDERAYPWGDAAPSCGEANHEEAGGFCVAGGDTDRVGARPAGVGPYGAEDMAGNVAEWTADFYDAAYYAAACASGCTDPAGPGSSGARVVRGGSWDDSAAAVRAAARNSEGPGARDDKIGFRCASDLP
ncbi:MAG: SUMF1/EgtB/PvdO family nonheme iron enzyme [Myxococcota bacterium]|nr:SUMF1/EgtB/PvdO family nonheme iron enzyme [Myxococcota bacterium]